MFKVCKEHGRRLIKVLDYCKSHYLGTQWVFYSIFFLPPDPKVSVESQLFSLGAMAVLG